MPKERKGSKELSEIHRIGTMLEEVRDDVKLLREGHTLLDRKIDDQIRQLREEMHQEFSLVNQAIQTNSQDIKQLQAAAGELLQKAQRISDWMDAHERVHSG